VARQPRNTEPGWTGRVIRLFKVHYPLRAVILVAGETLMVGISFLLATILRYREDSYLVLNFEYGYYKIFAITVVVVLFCHWFDLYDWANFDVSGEVYFRLLLVPGLISLGLALASSLFPTLLLGHSALLLGLAILTVSLLAWRSAYSWLAQQPYLREAVYVLGDGERAERLIRGLETRPDLGLDVVGWSGDMESAPTRDGMASHLLTVAREKNVRHIIVAMHDRRAVMPMDALLQLRLRAGVRIEEATSWLEKISGKIEVEQLYPSWIIFAEGFRFSEHLLRRCLNCAVSLVVLFITAPLVPLIVAAIKIDSSGPAFYRQQRVGRGGKVFYCYKFRTMHKDAEVDIGPTWADDDDPRITKVGKFLRISRLDEIPQLWCVLKGDMSFVGPRPERPEFVQWLTQEIPYYGIRHLVRPGITGWAQIRYKYGNTVQDAKEKLQYDLFYIKNSSIALDIFIMFQTIKILLLRRGSQ
jgi:sugar transferase (PEP-CTERM system associated)